MNVNVLSDTTGYNFNKYYTRICSTNPQTYSASLSFCRTTHLFSYNEAGCIMGKLDLMSFARWVSLRGTPFQFLYANINVIYRRSVSLERFSLYSPHLQLHCRQVQVPTVLETPSLRARGNNNSSGAGSPMARAGLSNIWLSKESKTIMNEAAQTDDTEFISPPKCTTDS